MTTSTQEALSKSKAILEDLFKVGEISKFDPVMLVMAALEETAEKNRILAALLAGKTPGQVETSTADVIAMARSELGIRTLPGKDKAAMLLAIADLEEKSAHNALLRQLKPALKIDHYDDLPF